MVTKIKRFFIASGSHESDEKEQKRCAMEWASYLAGEEHSDEPHCVDEKITGLMIHINDSTDDETRQKLRPFIVRSLGTRSDRKEKERERIVTDWIIRGYVPMYLEAAGYKKEAEQLRNLKPFKGRVRKDILVALDTIEEKIGADYSWINDKVLEVLDEANFINYDILTRAKNIVSCCDDVEEKEDIPEDCHLAMLDMILPEKPRKAPVAPEAEEFARV